MKSNSIVKSASLGEDFDQNMQGSFSQILNPSGLMGISKNTGISNKAMTHSKQNSHGLLLVDNDSSKETNQHLLFPLSLNPLSSQTVNNSQRTFDPHDDQGLNSPIQLGAREGAAARSRLFMESQDMQPKFGGSQDEVPLFADGETASKGNYETASKGNNEASFGVKITQPYSSQIKISNETEAAKIPRQNNPRQLSYVKTNSNSQQTKAPLKDTSTATAANQPFSQSAIIPQLQPSQTQPPTTDKNNKSPSYPLHDAPLWSGFPLSLTKSPNNPRQSILLQSQGPFQMLKKQPTRPQVSTSAVFMKVNRFAYVMKKLLLFMRPQRLNKMQVECICDKSAMDFGDIAVAQKQDSAELKHATRLWITNRKPFNWLIIRKIKQKLKFLYIAIYLCRIRMDQIFNKIANTLPEPLNPGGVISRTIDILCLLSTILCYLFIPLDYAFQIDDPWSWIKKGTAITLFVQILLKFNTSQFYHGSLVSDRTHIAWNYLTSSFIFDFISTLSLVYCPFDYASLIFFLRFLYSPSISFKFQEICAKHKRISGILNLLRIFLLALYNCHIIACFWFYIGRYETQDNSNATSWINTLQLSIQTSSKYELYLQSIYFAVMTLTSSKGEIFPQTNREKIFIVFVSVYACCFVAYIVYSVIQACKQFNQNQAVYLTQLASLNKYLDSHSVSYGLCDQARKYVEYINSEGMKDRQESIKSLDNLSTNLREEIAKDIFTKSFTRNPILNRYFSNKMFMEALSMKVRETVFGPGEVIVKSNRNDVPCLYFIIQGEVELFAEIGERGLMKQGNTKIFNVLGKSDCFGQLEFFQQTFNTSVSARARGFTHVMAVSLLDFQEAAQRFPEQKEAFCYLKDCVNLNSQFDLIGISCYSCHSDSHTLMSCPYLFYHQGRQRILIQSEAIQHQLIAQFKRSPIRKKFNGLSSHARLLNSVQAFHQANQDILNTSIYDEYQEVEEEDDEDESEQRSFRKQQTCPHFDERSNYTRHTSKKASLKQTQTAEESSFQRKNSKNQSLKMLNPNLNNSNNPEDIHEKSQISRISQFSNRPRNQQEPFSEDKKGLLTPAASQPNLDSDLAASQNRRRTHSGVSNIIGSRKSPFPSDREMNRSYSGSLISSLRLSEADRRVLALEEKGTDGSKQPQQMGSAPPNVVVIKVNEGEEYSIVSHRGGPYSGVSSSQFAPNSFEPSSDYQARRRNSNFSLISRGIVQSSQLGSTNQPIDEISELRLDQTNRFRENSFVPNNLMENDLPQLRYYLNNNNSTGNVLNLNNSNFNNLNLLGSNHLNIDDQQDNFEEQQNFKLYFAHNNLQNIINQPKSKKPSNQLKPANQKSQKRSSFIRVVSVNNKISNHQMVSNSINNNQLDILPGLMPVNVSPFVE